MPKVADLHMCIWPAAALGGTSASGRILPVATGRNRPKAGSRDLRSHPEHHRCTIGILLRQSDVGKSIINSNGVTKSTSPNVRCAVTLLRYFIFKRRIQQVLHSSYIATHCGFTEDTPFPNFKANARISRKGQRFN